MSTKAERIKIVNDIIKAIALNGRNFFLNNKDNDMAYFLEKNGRLYMYNEYNKTEMYLHTIELENQEWYWNKTIEQYRADKNRAIERARKAEIKIAELEKQIEHYKKVLG